MNRMMLFGRVLFSFSIALLVLLGTSPGASAISGGFIENRGQIDSSVRYYSIGSRVTFYFTSDAVVLDVKEEFLRPDKSRHPLRGDEDVRDHHPRRGWAVYLRFEGATSSPKIEARGELLTRYNYFIGNDPDKWRTDVPAYSEVVYRDLWPGVDLVFREEERTLAYEIVSSPNALVESVGFKYEGADRVVVKEDGSSVIETPVGSLLDLPSDRDTGRGSLVAGETYETQPSQKDNPSALLWSTLLGAGSDELAMTPALDESCNVFVAGPTTSADFPATPGAYDELYNGGYRDFFVARVSSTGSSLHWSTFLGGSEDENNVLLALDPSGNPTVTGNTSSWDFPTTPGAYDESWNDYLDGFVAKLSPAGNTLLWSTFLGGSGDDYVKTPVFDSSGNIVVTGRTDSSDFPTTPGAYDTSLDGWCDVYVARISATGSALLSSTYLGGSDGDQSYGLTLDLSGNAILSGLTDSPDFPTTAGAYDESWNGDHDAFVAKINSAGSSLMWSSFLGGSDYDIGGGLALDPSGNAVLTGYTLSSDFPTTPGAYDESWNGDCDVLVAKISSTGSSLLWSTLLGGGSTDYGVGLALDPSGNAIVTGGTGSTDFPTTPGAYDESWNGGVDVLLAKLDISFETDVTEPPVSAGRTRLVSAVPNPFGQVTEIRYRLESAADVELAVFDVTGRRVRTLVNGVRSSGDHSTYWNGRDNRGNPVASGLYFVKCTIPGDSYYGRVLRIR